MISWRWTYNDSDGADPADWPVVPDSEGLGPEPSNLEWSLLPSVMDWLEDNQCETEHYENGSEVEIEIALLDGDVVLGRWKASATLEYRAHYTHSDPEVQP